MTTCGGYVLIGETSTLTKNGLGLPLRPNVRAPRHSLLPRFVYKYREHLSRCASRIPECMSIIAVPIASLFPNHPTRIEPELAFAFGGLEFVPQFETNHFIMLLSFVQEGLACAIVDPLTAESHKLFSDKSKKVVFRPLMMDITFSVEKLTPGFRPASILAKAFDDFLRSELIRLGAEQVGAALKA